MQTMLGSRYTGATFSPRKMIEFASPVSTALKSPPFLVTRCHACPVRRTRLAGESPHKNSAP
jgi:hypothetical protein